MSKTQTETTTTDTEQDERPKYEFFFPETEAKHDRVMLAIKFRQFLDNMPETKATFSFLGKRFDDWTQYGPLTKGQRTALRSMPLWFFGVWRLVPPHKTDGGGNNRYRYVNPNYPHSHKYPDCVIQCNCGIYQSHLERPPGETLGLGGTHSDTCLPEWKYDTRAEIFRKRRRIITDGLLYDLQSITIASRMGLRRSGYKSTKNKMKIDVEGLRTEARKRKAHTADELLLQGYSKAEVGQAIGMGYQGLRGLLKNHDLYFGRHDE